ncbi:MAG: VCBS repeat-containing protein [Myxococcota bacterium]
MIGLALVGCKPKYIDQQPTPSGETGSTVVGDDDDDDDTVIVPEVKFDSHLVGSPDNPAWAAVGDVLGGSSPEIVVSAIGKLTEPVVPAGRVVAYAIGGSLDSWTETEIVGVASGIEYPGQPLLHDVDGDGDTDVFLPSGGRLCNAANTPCGGLQWFENTGSAWLEHVLLTGSAYYYTATALGDMDGDGIEDLVAAAEDFTTDTSQLHLFRGLGGGSFDPVAFVLDANGGPVPILEDVDGDGDLDVLTGESFYTGTTFAWVENQGAAFPVHVISNTYGPGYEIRFVDDLYGDGQKVAVATNHTNTARLESPDPWESVVLSFALPADPTGPWTGTVLSLGIQAVPDVALFPHPAPGSFATGDADGDGDKDIVVAGDGDPNVYLLDQQPDGTFVTRILSGGLGQAGGTAMADLDEDGDLEMVMVAGVNNGVFVVSRE